MVWNRKSNDTEKRGDHTATADGNLLAPIFSSLSLQPVNTLGVPINNTHVAPTNNDDALLEKLGYKAELKRDFSPLELFGVSFSIMGLAPSIASILIDQIPAGGVGLTWGWFIPCIFIFMIGISMSEMASAMPTAGGLYFWTYLYAPKSWKWKSLLSFICGYSDTLGLIGGVGSINYGAASQILSSVTLGTGYEPSNGVTFLVFMGITIIQCFMGFIPNRLMAKVQSFTIVMNMVAMAIVCIALPIGMKKHGLSLNSAKFVFGDTANYTSYPYGMSFMLAWMAPIWTISSQDSCVHMAEEASNASTAVPFGILMSVFLCWIFGWVILCVLAACIDASPEGMNELMNANLPMANIIERSLNSNWAIGLMSFFCVIQTLMGLSALISSSRQSYAFARDDALPFSRYIKRTTKGQLPVPALVFSSLVAILIGLLILAGPTAANAIFSLGMSALYLAWIMPIFCYAFSNARIENPGPFYLGHFWSKTVAIIASLFGVYVIFGLSMLPADIPVSDGDSMNYSCVVCGFVWIAAIIYWFVDAQKWYNGPKMTMEEDSTMAEVLEASEWKSASEQHNNKEKVSEAPSSD